MEQQISYAQKMRNLMKQPDVTASSFLKTLQPFIEKEGLLRVEGKLQQFPLPYQTTQQMILPSNHRFTNFCLIRARRTSPCWATNFNNITTRGILDSKSKEIGEISHSSVPNLL